MEVLKGVAYTYKVINEDTTAITKTWANSRLQVSQECKYKCWQPRLNRKETLSRHEIHIIPYTTQHFIFQIFVHTFMTPGTFYSNFFEENKLILQCSIKIYAYLLSLIYKHGLYNKILRRQIK